MGSSDFEGAEFRRVVGAEARTVAPALSSRRRASVVTLIPMRSLSLDAFAFPFSNAAKVREALKLKVLPYAAGGGVEIFPVTLEKAGRGISGIAWYVASGELESLPGGDAGVVWPAPLPLVSRVGGTGVTLWKDEENLCSLLWQEGRPVLSRWRPRSSAGPESEAAWFDRYCKERELTRGGTFVFDAEDGDASASLREIVKESLALCPWLGTVNLSRTALEGAMGLERNVRLLARVACWGFLIGGVVLTGSLLRWNWLQEKAGSVRGRSEALYREVFDPAHTGRISNPVSLARDKIAQLQGGDFKGRRFEDALADLGEIYAEASSLDVAVDVLRYNAEGLDLTGVAPDMSTILTFRKAWEGRAALSQLDNTQGVPGVGYLFDLRVRW